MLPATAESSREVANAQAQDQGSSSEKKPFSVFTAGEKWSLVCMAGVVRPTYLKPLAMSIAPASEPYTNSFTHQGAAVTVWLSAHLAQVTYHSRVNPLLTVCVRLRQLTYRRPNYAAPTTTYQNDAKFTDIHRRTVELPNVQSLFGIGKTLQDA